MGGSETHGAGGIQCHGEGELARGTGRAGRGGWQASTQQYEEEKSVTLPQFLEAKSDREGVL